MISETPLEELAEKRSDDTSVIAETMHVRLSYPDLLAIRDGEYVQVGPIGFQMRNPDAHPQKHPDADFTVLLWDADIEELREVGHVIDHGLRSVGGTYQFLHISAGGISDDIGKDMDLTEVERWEQKFPRGNNTVMVEDQ